MSVGRIEQFFILNARGNTILSRNYLSGDLRASVGVFYETVQFGAENNSEKKECPFFNQSKRNFVFLHTDEMLYFVACSTMNLCPSLTIECLESIHSIFTDYCGILTEEQLQRNFILCYEIIDLLIDNGYIVIQTRSDILKPYLSNRPLITPSQLAKIAPKTSSFLKAYSRHQPMDSANKPIMVGELTSDSNAIIKKSLKSPKIRKAMTNEIFVDVVETITVLLNKNGRCECSNLHGIVKLKSYLAGNPAVSISFNDNLIISNLAENDRKKHPIYGSIILDDIIFNDIISDLASFDSKRILRIDTTPDGALNLCNYRISNVGRSNNYDGAAFPLPFAIIPSVNVASKSRIEVFIKLRSQFPKHINASNVTVTLPIHCKDSILSNVSAKLGSIALCGGRDSEEKSSESGESTRLGKLRTTMHSRVDYNEAQKKVIWKVSKFAGYVEQTLRVKLFFRADIDAMYSKLESLGKMGVGPVNLTFDLNMHTISGFKIRYLKVKPPTRDYNPFRWIRYISKTQSYVCRL